MMRPERAQQLRLPVVRHLSLGWLTGTALLGSCWLGLGAQGPANNTFANRIVLTGTNITVTGSNVGGTKENGEPDHADNWGGSSVWWTWTAPANGEVRITTDGSDFDTLLGVYTGARVNSLAAVAANDDHGVLVTSRVRFAVIQGTQYAISVDGYNDDITTATGNITLTLVFARGPFNRPVNDNFTNRLALPSQTLRTNAVNVQATREPDEPFHAEILGDTSIWFSWTAPTSGTIRISTEGSSFDTLLGVYSGTALANLSEIASSDDIDPDEGILTSAVTFEVNTGEVFQIAVDGYDGAEGQITLQIETISTRLDAPRRLPDGQFQFTLTGVPGRTYDLEASTSFVFWERVVRMFNTNGTVVITDPVATNAPLRFYRATLLP